MPNQADLAELIGSAESAAILEIDRATFNRWVAIGRVKAAAELPGRTGARLFRRADVEALKAGDAA